MARLVVASTVVVLVVLSVVAHAHICAIDPPQRGGFNVSVPGDNSCYIREGPCGGTTRGANAAEYLGASVVTVLFQQNLNHFYPARVGVLDVSIALTAEPTSNDEFTVLASVSDWPAFEQVWQTNLTLSVLMPDVAKATLAVLRYRYVAYNPDEVYPANNTDAVFYNCVDIALAPAGLDAKKRVAEPVVRAPSPPAPAPCFSPREWSATSVEESAVGFVHRQYAYDTNSAKVYIRRTGAVSPDRNVLAVTTWTHFNDNLNEWVMFEYSNMPAVCELYGADGFYPWGYGAQYNQTFVGKSSLPNGGTGNVWTIGAFIMAANEQCLPAVREQTNGQLFEAFSNQTASIADKSILDPPPMCLQLRTKRAHC